MSDSVLGRLLLPIAEETDAEATCDAVRPYLGDHDEVIVVHVLESETETPSDAEQERADTIFEIAREQLAGAVDSLRTELEYGSDPIEEIIASAKALDASAIGFTPRPENRWIKMLSADGTNRLMAEGELPVVIFPHPDQATDPSRIDDATEPIRRVLVPVDGSGLSLDAVRHACSVHPESTVTALHVERREGANVYDSMASGPSDEAAEADRKQDRETAELFEEARAIADEYDTTLSTEVLSGNVPSAILTCAEETDTDLIVMARHGRSGLKESILGSTTESVIRDASVPVTVVQ
jgi:nucleotide-binding universal stress UspA family protein